jgi:hypothetical protein
MFKQKKTGKTGYFDNVSPNSQVSTDRNHIRKRKLSILSYGELWSANSWFDHLDERITSIDAPLSSF